MPCIVILLINTIPDHQGRFKIIIQSVQTELKGRCIPMYGSSRSQFFQGMFFPALVIITVITGFIQRNRQQILFCQCIRLHDITIGFLPGKKHIRRYLPTGFQSQGNAFQVIIFIGRSVGRKTFARFLVSDDNLRFPGSKTTPGH